MNQLLGWIGILAMFGVLTAAALTGGLAATPAVALQGDAAVGEEVFAANCASCHGPEAQGMGTAPALGGVVDRLGRDVVETTIRQGRAAMPSFEGRLTDEQITDVIAHLDTLPPAAAQQRRPRGHGPMGRMWDDMMGDGMMGGLGWLWMLLWFVLSVALVALVVLAVVWLARSIGSGGGRPTTSNETPGAGGPRAAREALDLRYARGDISRDDYLQARRDLDGPAG